MNLNKKKFPIYLLSLYAFVFLWSVINPHHFFTWILEVMPVLLGVPILFLTYKKFPLTPLLYFLIFIHAIILTIGAHYTYAHVPLFDWVKEIFHFDRNHYDRLGHFAQGFIPAILTREILLRTSPLKPGKWLFFLVCSVCLAFSAFYEFIEWWVALLTGTAAEAFLGTQGDIWDTQWDMFLALLGAISALIFLSKIHDKQLKTIK